MVFNKTFVFACLLGLIATSVAYPAAERAESAVETTVRSLSDDIVEEAAVTATTEQLVLADEVAATTELSVRSEDAAPVEPEQNNVIAVEEVVIPVEKTSPVVVAEVIESNNNAGPAVVEVVEIVPVNNNVKFKARALVDVIVPKRVRQFVRVLFRSPTRRRRVPHRRRNTGRRSSRESSPGSHFPYWPKDSIDASSYVNEHQNDFDGGFWIADKRKGVSFDDQQYNGGHMGYEDRRK